MKILNRIGVNAEEEVIASSTEALSYIILHMAKINASDEEFEAIFEQTGLNSALSNAFRDALKPKLNDFRELLHLENQSDSVRYKDFDWRLSMVTACRQHQKIMQPKFSTKLELQQLTSQKSSYDMPAQNQIKIKTCIFDMDYTMMKRFEEELGDAVKSIEGQYSRKVLKFIK